MAALSCLVVKHDCNSCIPLLNIYLSAGREWIDFNACVHLLRLNRGWKEGRGGKTSGSDAPGGRVQRGQRSGQKTEHFK